jgi:arginine decarboxylase
MTMMHQEHPRAVEGAPVLSGTMNHQSSTVAALAAAGLSVSVVPATGHGPTRLAAFDAALRGAGVANFNLVRLSSVIPPGTTVLSGELGSDRPIDLRNSGLARRSVPGGWGDRLYAVWAFQSAELLGQEAWAGVAWSQDPSDGRGLFVEHEGSSEAQVREELEASLESICAARGMDHLDRHFVVTGTRCEGEPVAALVIAPYQTASWASPGSADR